MTVSECTRFKSDCALAFRRAHTARTTTSLSHTKGYSREWERLTRKQYLVDVRFQHGDICRFICSGNGVEVGINLLFGIGSFELEKLGFAQRVDPRCLWPRWRQRVDIFWKYELVSYCEGRGGLGQGYLVNYRIRVGSFNGAAPHLLFDPRRDILMMPFGFSQYGVEVVAKGGEQRAQRGAYNSKSGVLFPTPACWGEVGSRRPAKTKVTTDSPNTTQHITGSTAQHSTA